MILTSKASLARIGALLLLSAGTLSLGCKSAGKDATAKGATAPQAAAGPCPEFVSAICGKAGKESQVCQSVTSTVELLSPAACKAASKDVSFALQKLGDQRKVCDHLASRLARISATPPRPARWCNADQDVPA